MSMQLAQTILNQLGGRRFTMMTGAKNLVATEEGLNFRLPSRFAKLGINVVKVTLTPMDVYDVEFGKLWGSKYTVLKTVEGIYCNMLQKTFTEETGLDTRL